MCQQPADIRQRTWHGVRFVLMFMMLRLIPAGSSLAEEQSGHRVAKSQFIMTIPEDWEDVSLSSLKPSMDALLQQAPQATMPDWLAAFQKQRSDSELLQYPYVLVQWVKSPRPTTAQLKNAGNVDISLQMKQEEKALKEVMSGVDAKRMTYDPELNLVWMKMQMEVDGVGRIQALSAMFPSEKGMLNFYCYDLQDDFSATEPLFREMVKSIQLTPDWAYRKRWLDDVPIVNDLRAERIGNVVGGIIGGLFVMWWIRFRKKSRTSSISDQ